MYCISCGAKNYENANFCYKCGQDLSKLPHSENSVTQSSDVPPIQATTDSPPQSSPEATPTDQNQVHSLKPRSGVNENELEVITVKDFQKMKDERNIQLDRSSVDIAESHEILQRKCDNLTDLLERLHQENRELEMELQQCQKKALHSSKKYAQGRDPSPKFDEADKSSDSDKFSGRREPSQKFREDKEPDYERPKGKKAPTKKFPDRKVPSPKKSEKTKDDAWSRFKRWYNE